MQMDYENNAKTAIFLIILLESIIRLELSLVHSFRRIRIETKNSAIIYSLEAGTALNHVMGGFRASILFALMA